MCGEICFYFFLILIVVTVVGHGLWLFFAAIFKGLGGPAHPPSALRVKRPPRRPGIVECPRCSEKLPTNLTDCPRCGLDLEGLVAEELADLEATARQLERLRRGNLVSEDVLAELWKVVQVRHQRLVGEPQHHAPATPIPPLPVSPKSPKLAPQAGPVHESISPHPVEPPQPEKPPAWVETHAIEPIRNGLEVETKEPVPAVVPASQVAEDRKEPGEEPPWRRLQLLLENRNEAELTSSERVKLVMWYRQANVEQLEALPATTQLKLARLLLAARLDEEALRTYQCCLARYPQHPDYVKTALEATRLAVRLQSDVAKSLVQDLLTRSLSPQQETETRRLAWTLGLEPAPSARAPAAEPVPQLERPPSPVTAGPPKPAEPVPPPPKKSKWSDLLAAFMEERNILWGELVGGLLIVGGSIALVISLWRTLQQNPYFPFGIFAGITLALFGAALYTWGHWKLQTTSRGLLTIAALLVPLSFLVMPRMLHREADERWELLIAVTALAIFGWCLYRATRVLVPQGRWLLPAAVLIPCMAQLITARVLGDEQPTAGTLLLLGLLPAGCFGMTQGLLVHRLRRQPEFDKTAAASVLSLLGLAVFALVVALWFLVASSAEPLLSLKQITSLLALAGIPVLGSGLLLHERLSEERQQTEMRTVGTAILLTGMALMLAAVGLAWPLPWAMTVACAVSLAALLWFALRHDLPLAHIPAVVCLTIGFLSIFHLGESFTPELAGQLLRQFWSMATALKLTALALALVAVAAMLTRWKKPHGLPYAGGAVCLAGLAVLLATWHGIDAPREAALVYTLGSLGILAANLRVRRFELSYAGLVLLTGATLWGLQAWVPETASIWSVVLAGEALLLAMVGAVLLREETGKKEPSDATPSPSPPAPLPHLGARGAIFGWPCLGWTEWVAVLAIGFALWSGWWQTWQLEHILAGGLLLCLYLLLTALQGRQVTATLAGVVLVGTVIAGTDWLTQGLAFGEQNTLIALAIAGTITLMALGTLIIYLREESRIEDAANTSPSQKPWYAIFPLAWREVILVSGLLALWLSVSTETFLVSRWHTLTLAAVAASAWLLVWQHRSVVLSWIGSFLFLIAMLHGLNWMLELDTLRLVLMGLLLHATVVIVAALSIRRFWRDKMQIDHLFTRPLLLAGMIGSFLALPVLVLDTDTVLTRSLHAFWLAALWLAVAWSFRWRWLLAGSQLVSILAVVLVVTAWLQQQSWVLENAATGLWDPRSLQAYGVGLAVLCWLWILARIGLQKNPVGRELLLPDWPGVDHLLLGFLVLAQLGLADWAILREVVVELTPQGMEPFLTWWPATVVHAFGPGAWLLLGALAVVLGTALWQPIEERGSRPDWRPAPTAVLGMTILLLAVPPLLAGNFMVENAAASALRWSMAAVFLAASIPVWLRNRIAGFAARWHIQKNGDMARRIRAVLVDGLVLPVLLLTIIAAGLQFRGFDLTGPTGTIFAQLGPVLSLSLPLLILGAALVGHALRENSAAYAFSAGQMLTLAIAGGFALYLLPDHPFFGAFQWVQLLQVTAICMAGWAVVWQVCHAFAALEGHYSNSRTPPEPRKHGTPLFQVQIAIPAAINFCLLLVGAASLVSFPDARLLLPGEVWYPTPTNWTLAAGAPLGWVTLAITVLAVHLWSGRTYSSLGTGGLCLALIALLGCTVAAFFPAWGFRTVLVGLAAFVLGLAAVPWLVARKTQEEKSLLENYARSVAGWINGVGVLLLLLALHAGLIHQDRLFAAGILALNGLGLALGSIQRRSESGLFGSGLILNVATILAVWHFHRIAPFDQWWILLLQLNGITFALVALAWLHLFGTLYRKKIALGELTSFLTWQAALAILTLAVPVGLALVLLLADPGEPPLHVTAHLAGWLGWVHLLLALAAWLGFAAVRVPRQQIHFLGVAGLLVVAQVTATASLWDGGNWFAYHWLIGSLALLGVVLLTGGWTASSLGELGPRAWSAEQRERFAHRLLDLFPALRTQRWVEGIGMVLVGLALRGSLEDPAPWWPVLAMLLSFALAVGLLFWTLRTGYLHIAGSLLTFTGIVAWLTLEAGTLRHLFLFSVISLAIASLVTTWLEHRLHKMGQVKPLPRRLTVMDHVAGYSLYLVVGLVVLLVLVVSPQFWSSGQHSITILGMIPALILPLSISVTLVFLVLSTLKKSDPPNEEDKWEPAPFSQQSCLLGLNLLGILLLIGLASDLSEMGLHLAGPLAWVAWGVVLAASFIYAVGKRSRQTSIASFPLYLGGLLGVLLGLHQLELSPVQLCRLAGFALACYLLLVSVLFFHVARFRLKTASEEAPPQLLAVQPWLPPLQMFFGLLVVGLSIWTVSTFPTMAGRILGPASVFLLVVAFLHLAQPGIARLTAGSFVSVDHLRYTTLILGTVLVLVRTWAAVDPADADVWLLRHILLLGTLGGATVVYGLGLPWLLPRGGPWSACSRNLGRVCWVLGLAAALSVIAHEFALYQPDVMALLMDVWAIGLVAITMLALIVSSLWFALRPAHDPFTLPEQRRTLYVYAAEILLFLLFFHLRLSAPMLYTGPLRQYGPVILMIIAFAGVGLSELFSRRNLPVLAIPLQRTGVFLPLIPLLTFWFASGDLWQLLLGARTGTPPAAQPPGSLDFSRYALYWFLAGGLYLLVAGFRRSPLFALLAVLSVNFGFWSLLFHYRDFGLDFFTHPQLWLIPLALIILIAEYINRDRLTPAVSQGLRYFGLVVIYLSSTADLFIAGLDDLAMSLVLLVLSLLGIFAGIQLRVKAFLFTGMIFLVLVIFARIWHAAVNLQHTWVWWASLIVLGAAILTLFAIFEKRRADLLRMLEEFKHWK